MTPVVSSKRLTLYPYLQDLFAPKERITLSAWAEKYYRLPAGERYEGAYRLARVPYAAGILDALSVDDPCERVVYKKPNQCGATEMANIWFAYIIRRGLGRIMQIQPQQEDARRHSNVRIKQLEKQPILDGLISEAKSRERANNTFQKEYPGGIYILTWSTTKSGLQSTPIAFVHGDEVNRYPLALPGEGRPTDIAARRTETFKGLAKLYFSSTPSIDGSSLITEMWEASTRGKFLVPCQHCGTFQWMEWERVQWPKGEPHKAMYYCISCAAGWSEPERLKSIALGEWRHEIPWQEGIAKGFWHNGLVMTFRTMADRAVEFERIPAARDPEIARINFYQGILAQDVSENVSEFDVDPTNLMSRRETYSHQVPDGVLVVTAGADVQGDRIECEIVGWGFGEESWSIGYHVLPGDTTGTDVWDAFERLINTPLDGPKGPVYIRAVCVDSNYRNTEAKTFCQRPTVPDTWAIIGAKTDRAPLFPPVANRNKRDRLPFRIVNSSESKRVNYSRIKLTPGTPGSMHFPADRDGYGEPFFAGFVAEKLVYKYDNKGNPRQEWVHDRRTPNEPTDCRAYAYIAVHGIGVLHNTWLPMPKTDTTDPEPTSDTPPPTLPADLEQTIQNAESTHIVDKRINSHHSVPRNPAKRRRRIRGANL